MSHVIAIPFRPTDLAALSEACEPLDCEYLPELRTFKWYGRHVGDYPLPQGFQASDMGRCDAGVIRVKGAGPNTYEIGVCKARDGRDGYVLLLDFWQGGYGLLDKVGEGASKLAQEYAAAATRLEARRLGGRVTQSVRPDGRRTVQIRMTQEQARRMLAGQR